jgi:hypothetical protein
MTAGVWVTADQTRVVPEGSPEAAFRLHLRDAERLGLIKTEKVEAPSEPEKVEATPQPKPHRRSVKA